MGVKIGKEKFIEKIKSLQNHKFPHEILKHFYVRILIIFVVINDKKFENTNKIS